MRAYKGIEDNISDEILDTFKTSIEQSIDKFTIK